MNTIIRLDLPGKVRAKFEWRSLKTTLILVRCTTSNSSHSSTQSKSPLLPKNWISIVGQSYLTDSWFNISPKILDLLGRNLHNEPNHPLFFLKSRIVDFFYKRPSHNRHRGSGPLFSVHDNLSPVVGTGQNFDSLLVGQDHVSRRLSDSYYVNQNTVLRSHTSAHESDLIKSGLDAFLVTGDVYRRDDIDSFHYPAFHQLEGVRLFSSDELFCDAVDPSGSLSLLDSKCNFEIKSAVTPPSSSMPPDRQPCHTLETVCSLEFQLKSVLSELATHLFGKDVPLRWIPAYFPFTHPSWELEIKFETKKGDFSDGWTEMLGCGILRQEILHKCGAHNKAAYAFGLGLERWAMKLYEIPDIRLFWSRDSGFLNQFISNDLDKIIKYRPVSVFPQCTLDLSFWLPASGTMENSDSIEHDQSDSALTFEREFFEIIRDVAGDIVEQVTLIDRFTDPKNSRQSRCYRIVYRHHHRTLTMEEIRPLHQKIGKMAESQLNVCVR